MTLTVSVTQVHIDQGTPGKCRSCPIALALRELFPDPSLDIAVAFSGFEITPVTMDWSVELPSAARMFIERYDCEDTVQPFTFSVEIPPSLVPYLKSKT